MIETTWTLCNFYKHFEFWKTFASPIATFVAALAAVGVTLYFNRAQKHIAEAQKDIAFNKLKLELFDRRYAIMESIKSLAKECFAINLVNGIDQIKIRELREKIDNSCFFFSQNIQDFIKEIDRVSECISA